MKTIIGCTIGMFALIGACTLIGIGMKVSEENAKKDLQKAYLEGIEEGLKRSMMFAYTPIP